MALGSVALGSVALGSVALGSVALGSVALGLEQLSCPSYQLMVCNNGETINAYSAL